MKDEVQCAICSAPQAGIPVCKKHNPAKGALLYWRAATKAKDGCDGFLYHHNFITGFQDLIFSSREAAARFALRETLSFLQ